MASRRAHFVSHLAFLGLIGGAILAVPAPVHAVNPAAHLRGHQGFEAPGVPLRAHRDLRWSPDAPPARAAGWARLQAEIGTAFAMWDSVTGAPVRIVAEGVQVPGSVRSSSAARAFAWTFIERHLPVLAPGASVRDFVLVADHADGRERILGFEQTHGGLPVVGGRLHLRFVNDRLQLIGSEAFVDLPTPSGNVAPSEARLSDVALDTVRGLVDGTPRILDAADGPYLLPMVEPAAVRVREVVQVRVAVDSPPSEWTVWLDAQTGDHVAHEQTLRFGDVDVAYFVPFRVPALGPDELPAARARLTFGAQDYVTDGAGTFAAPDGPPADLTLRATGPFVDVQNSSGPNATFTQPGMLPQGYIAWGNPDDQFLDAQLASFIHAQIVKDHARGFADGLPWLDEQLPVTVNIDQTCNAFSDGNSINFFIGGDGCENTGRMGDVVYHEFGHSLHSQSLIEGVGAFEGALSEGVSDYLSATIVNDASVGLGFFTDLPTDPLRELDPEGSEWHWPEDTGEVHFEGQIIGGTLWDLRERLSQDLGPAEGVAHTDRIYYEATRRATDIPTMFPEALAVDDTDGDLSNGTPNDCAIVEVFGAHGLYQIPLAEDSLVFEDLGGQGYRVEVKVDHPFAHCDVQSMPQLSWQVRGEPGSGDTFDLQPSGQGLWEAFIPPQVDGTVLQYRVEIEHSVGTVQALPDNLVDPFYEHYVGPVVELYCTGFENDPFDEGWEFQGIPDDWDWGTPTGQNGDPFGAFAGTSAIGTALGDANTQGLYSPGASTLAVSPSVDTAGFSVVRLQYRRWLAVEDGFYDQATILADGAVAWGNYAGPHEDDAGNHHLDHEWRFHDVDLTPWADDGEVRIAFTLDSDGGLEFGGWALDELCIVGVDGLAPECGNGILEPGEECDDGNDVGDDGCTACEIDMADTGGDGDGDGDGDDGGDDGGESGGFGDSDYDLKDRGCACAATGESRWGPWGGMFMLGLLLLRRRRMTAPRGSR